MKKTKYAWNLLLILLITLLVLYFALKDDYQEVVQAISRMSIFGLAGVCIWGILYTVVWGCVYYVLGKKYDPQYTILQGITVAFVGAFFAGITPSSTGGQFGQAFIFKKQGIQYADGASILWADFIIYQTTMMIYTTVLLLLEFSDLAGQNAWLYLILVGYVVNLAVVIGLYTMAWFPNVYVWLAEKAAKILARWHILKNPEKTLQDWTLQVSSFTTQIKVLSRDKKSILYCFLINLVRLSLLYSLPFAVARALGIDIGWSHLLQVIALSAFVTMANSFIPIPGASGGTEVMFSVLFSPLFGAMTTAIMLLWRLSSYYIVIFIGGLTFFFASRSTGRIHHRKGYHS